MKKYLAKVIATSILAVGWYEFNDTEYEWSQYRFLGE